MIPVTSQPPGYRRAWFLHRRRTGFLFDSYLRTETQGKSSSTITGQIDLLDDARAFGQRAQERSAVGFGQDARVEDHDDAASVLVRIRRPKPCLSLITASGT